ncbi:MAG: dTDP-4-dehydrorhamnose 3,5-epimerase [Marinifilaceae bacterium]
MNIRNTNIPDVVIIEPRVFNDTRGYFFESYNKISFDELIGDDINFIQDNEAKSSYGVLRGLHFQKGQHAQAKLIRVVSGKVLDVAVDIRKDSPTFGKYVSQILSEENKLQLFIPHGFAHGYVALSKEVIFQYKCDNYYCPTSEAGIAFDDKELAIDWMIPREDMILSDKDLVYNCLAELI